MICWVNKLNVSQTCCLMGTSKSCWVKDDLVFLSVWCGIWCAFFLTMAIAVAFARGDSAKARSYSEAATLHFLAFQGFPRG